MSRSGRLPDPPASLAFRSCTGPAARASVRAVALGCPALLFPASRRRRPRRTASRRSRQTALPTNHQTVPFRFSSYLVHPRRRDLFLLPSSSPLPFTSLGFHRRSNRQPSTAVFEWTFKLSPTTTFLLNSCAACEVLVLSARRFIRSRLKPPTPRLQVGIRVLHQHAGRHRTLQPTRGQLVA